MTFDMTRIAAAGFALTGTVLFAAGCGGGVDEVAPDATPQQEQDSSDTEGREASGDTVTVGALTFTPPADMVKYEPENDTLASLTLTPEDTVESYPHDWEPPAILVFEEDSNPIFGAPIMISGKIKAWDPDAEITSEDDIEVPGSINASLMKSHYKDVDGYPTVQWDLLIGGEKEDEHFVLRYGAHVDEFDEQAAKAMVASARVGEEG
ncbi:hypothetical protein HNR23_000700 [Nocardiopsis mwathae]|uniref:Lipoprotein n=1 Tax=Nocardiopsis mwathae TaxID=1472723 RepID=A0A7W9YEW0_9ACTN|nr:hypothetical protein [Nocardiopsis mwathae]MBB6170640.1 hypothetical protein [Nocardiopsis mwathae]